ncbi:pyridoxal phosphate-dependent transferase [Mycena galopus ATCC 62051]|nr:pyridoxal phosphate-dependent transferase [Mycena galopus ATCC 62051]
MASVEAAPVKSLPESFYTPFLSEIAKARLPSPSKPNPAAFPFTSFSFTAQAPPPEDGQTAREDIELTLSGAELAAALQYGPTGGMASLIDWLYDLQRTAHGRERREGWALSVGGGSQDLLSKAIIALLNPGDPVLVQSPVYALKCEQIGPHSTSIDDLRAVFSHIYTQRLGPRTHISHRVAAVSSESRVAVQPSWQETRGSNRLPVRAMLEHSVTPYAFTLLSALQGRVGRMIGAEVEIDTALLKGWHFELNRGNQCEMCQLAENLLRMWRKCVKGNEEVEADADGISSESLRAILEGWPADRVKPKVLYTIPYGGNPTGATATFARRREVLQLAREHNFLIMEAIDQYNTDDPYFYLFYGPDSSRPPSYFAMERADTSSAGHSVGRVLPFDSISKILSAGMRIGFASGPTPILRVIDLHIATANLQPVSLTQAIAHKLLHQEKARCRCRPM